MDSEEMIKENKLMPLPLSWRWVCAGLAISACAMFAVARIDYALPEPLTRETGRPDQFIAQVAYEHLVNLTSIGPRVAGSYENEVLSVGMLVSAVKSIAAQASPHNKVELDVHRASGGFALTFMDGMNNVYRDVQSVVARVSGAGAREWPRTAILLNCHFDTVPDSPGASDDGAGCAVLLETLRALAATPRPLRHDAVFLFNGAEENILQASHAFITQHKWAKSVRAFINIEACGAGGREVLFQAGPHDPWIIEVYAGAVPHPFASSLAQELFESGLIPADTDFRIFRDFGKLSGVDLAWSANGYVYHTRLDTVQQIPPEALQRTGDNVLALAHGMLSSSEVESEVDSKSRQPVFFDVLGWYVVSARGPAAAALGIVTLLLVLVKLRLSIRVAGKELYLPPDAWTQAVTLAILSAVAAVAGGVGAAVAVAMVLHLFGARLTFYSRPLLLAPLYILPGVAAYWSLARWLWSRGRGRVPARGWWGARAAHDAHAALAGFALLLCAVSGLRSGFLPLLWALLPPLSDVIATAIRASPSTRAVCWAAGAALPLLQTCYLLLNSLHILVPTMGRAGAGPLPADVAMAVIATSLVLAALSWMLPFVMATRNISKLLWCMVAVCVVTVGIVVTTSLGSAYSESRPQRLMVFHTRQTIHPPDNAADAVETVDNFYWIPELDANTKAGVDKFVAGPSPSREVTSEECERWVYCGVPYFLPVLTLVGRSYVVPTKASPLPRITATLTTKPVDENTRAIHVNVTQAPQHVVLIVAPVDGAVLTWTNVVAEPLESAAWGNRKTYFITLHTARAPSIWEVQLHIQGAGEGKLADVALAGHAMFGDDKHHEEQARMLASMPLTVASTGWGVDLHLYSLY